MTLAAVDPPLSSLVSIPSNGSTSKGPWLAGCPSRPDVEWLNLETAEVRPARCGRNKCLWCGPINAVITAGAIDVARPERLVTFTRVGDDWQQIRRRVRKVRWRLAKRFGEVAWCWHVEPNPKGTGNHVHALEYGDRFIPQAHLSQVAASEGMGEVADIRRVSAQDRVGWYGLKMAAAAYTMKLARDEDTYFEYLRLNGERLVHASRGFWRDRAGTKLAGVGAGRRAALEEAFGPAEGRWILASKAPVENR